MTVLKQMVAESAALPEAQTPPPAPAYIPQPPPPSDVQAKLLEEVRDYATNYAHRLPDFICMEQTRRYVDTTGNEAWRQSDIVNARLSYFNQKEDYKLLSQNDRVLTGKEYTSVVGATSMGDFGTTMREIFEPGSHAHFEGQR